MNLQKLKAANEAMAIMLHDNSDVAVMAAINVLGAYAGVDYAACDKKLRDALIDLCVTDDHKTRLRGTFSAIDLVEA